jgi:hypothetical protein
MGDQYAPQHMLSGLSETLSRWLEIRLDMTLTFDRVILISIVTSKDQQRFPREP